MANNARNIIHLTRTLCVVKLTLVSLCVLPGDWHLHDPGRGHPQDPQRGVRVVPVQPRPLVTPHPPVSRLAVSPNIRKRKGMISPRPNTTIIKALLLTNHPTTIWAVMSVTNMDSINKSPTWPLEQPPFMPGPLSIQKSNWFQARDFGWFLSKSLSTVNVLLFLLTVL